MRAVAPLVLALLMVLPVGAGTGVAPEKLVASRGGWGLALGPSGEHALSYSIDTTATGLRARVDVRDAIGATQWTYDFPPRSTSASIAFTADGGLVAGTTVRQFDSINACTLDKCQVARFNTDGSARWLVATPGSTTSNTRVYGIAVTPGDDVLVLTTQHTARAAVAKMDGATGATLWRTVLQASFNVPRGIAATPDGGAIATGEFGTVRLSSSGAEMWRTLDVGADVAVDPASGDALVVTQGGLRRLAAATGAVVWDDPTTRVSGGMLGALAIDGDRVVAAIPFVTIVDDPRDPVLGLQPTNVVPTTMVYGERVEARALADGAFVWGFDHESGKKTEGGLETTRPSVAIAGGRLAVLAGEWDSAIYAVPAPATCVVPTETCLFAS